MAQNGYTIDGKVYYTLNEYADEMLESKGMDVKLAVCMADHPRLGENSLLSQIDDACLSMVLKFTEEKTREDAIYEDWQNLHENWHTFEEDDFWEQVESIEIWLQVYEGERFRECVRMQRELSLTIQKLEAQVRNREVYAFNRAQWEAMMMEKAYQKYIPVWDKKCESIIYSIEYRLEKLERHAERLAWAEKFYKADYVTWADMLRERQELIEEMIEANSCHFANPNRSPDY